MKIELGQTYRDKVSGWQGVATARYEYLNGCVRYQIDGQDQDGLPKGFVFDEVQLVEPIMGQPLEKTGKTGGPRDSTPVER